MKAFEKLSSKFEGKQLKMAVNAQILAKIEKFYQNLLLKVIINKFRKNVFTQ
jgi:hypothetical protein